jgi:hypothetical protein
MHDGRRVVERVGNLVKFTTIGSPSDDDTASSLGNQRP